MAITSTLIFPNLLMAQNNQNSQNNQSNSNSQNANNAGYEGNNYDNFENTNTDNVSANNNADTTNEFDDDKNSKNGNESNDQNENFEDEFESNQQQQQEGQASEETGDFTSMVMDRNRAFAFYWDRRGNPHPAAATYFALRRLVLTVQKPPEEKLNTCVREFRTTADQSLNTDALVGSLRLFSSAVAKNPNFYHWCFYHYLAAIEWKLDEDSLGLKLQTKMSLFTRNIKAIWLLARSLDDGLGTQIYYDYTVSRYLSLLKQHFGIDKERVGAPLGDPRWVEPPEAYKPAATFSQ